MSRARAVVGERKASYWGQYATPADPPAAQSGYGHYDFSGYDAYGRMVISTWTSSPGTFQAEVSAYQSRLNKSGDLARVEVSRRPGRWHDPVLLEAAHWTMYAKAVRRRD